MAFLKAVLLSLFFTGIQAKSLINFNASAGAGDPVSNLGILDLEGYYRETWPSGQAQNSSCYFKLDKDPAGIPAAHVHKDTNFTRAEYHMLKDKTMADTTYYIGYKVRFDAIYYQTFVWQWKNYDSNTVGSGNVPAVLTFQKDSDDSDYHTIKLQVDPSASSSGAVVAWTQKLTMKQTYTFGIVINTSQISGYMQLYFDGALATLTDANGNQSQKLAGNFFSGSSPSVSPKVGLYGDGAGDVAVPTCDSYIYNVVVGTSLSEIKSIPGMVS